MAPLSTSLAAAKSAAASFLGRIAVRLALLQAAILIGILGCVAYFGHLAQEKAARNVIESCVLGEVASLREEIAMKGVDHLPHTIAKRSRIWRGFEYRLTGSDGGYLAGILPQPDVTTGWSVVPQHNGKEARQIVAYSERLPNGGLLP